MWGHFIFSYSAIMFIWVLLGHILYFMWIARMKDYAVLCDCGGLWTRDGRTDSSGVVISFCRSGWCSLYTAFSNWVVYITDDGLFSLLNAGINFCVYGCLFKPITDCDALLFNKHVHISLSVIQVFCINVTTLISQDFSSASAWRWSPTMYVYF